MALALALDDAKKHQFRKDGNDAIGIIGKTIHTPFFGSRDTPEVPLASLNQLDPGRLSTTHFHIVDQFQIAVDGKAKLGRHDLTPYCVHFARAYTPYGPLLSDTDDPLTYFVLRAHFDPGSQHLPHARDKLKQMPDRQPWQIMRPVTFPTLQSGAAAADIMLQAIPDIKDDKGLAAYTLSMKANARTGAPDPSDGDGQFVVVVKGSLLHHNKEHRALALVYIKPDEGPFQILAGSQGLEALVLNYPRAHTRTTGAATSVRTTSSFKTWQCALCAFVYDEAAGLPEEGIAPGTRWQDVPETWNCPDCNASKGDFQMIELIKN